MRRLQEVPVAPRSDGFPCGRGLESLIELSKKHQATLEAFFTDPVLDELNGVTLKRYRCVWSGNNGRARVAGAGRVERRARGVSSPAPADGNRGYKTVLPFLLEAEIKP